MAKVVWSAISLIVCWCAVCAAQASDFYTDAGLTYNILEIGELEYNPLTVRAKAGYVVIPEIAIEAQIGTNVYRDEVEDQRYEVRNLAGLFLRYGTPVFRRFRAYLAAGYTYVNLDITNALGNRFEEHKDYSWAVGLEENLKTFKDVSFTLEYARYIDEGQEQDKFILSGISMGFRAAF